MNTNPDSWTQNLSSRMVRFESYPLCRPFFSSRAVPYPVPSVPQPGYAGSEPAWPQFDPLFTHRPPLHYYYFAPNSLAPPIQGSAPVMNYPPPPVAIFPDLGLSIKIRDQIHYYFSKENLVKDIYLRHNMDEEGWVSIELIASFPKIQLLTKDIRLILEAVKNSHLVELKGDKIRKRSDWMRWLIPPSLRIRCGLSSQSSGQSSNCNRPATHDQKPLS